MGFVDTMKSGEWLTAARIRAYSMILAGLPVMRSDLAPAPEGGPSHGRI
jgi:hypothetical protein